MRGHPQGWPQLFLIHLKTFVYIDGFNLFYGALKKTPYKWLDVAKLCRLLLPNHQVLQIRYFTAIVHARRHDPGAPTRQQFYLRALRTIPNLSIHLGQFRSHAVPMPLATSTAVPPKTATVIKTEEKGSDVNLATFLLLDGFRNSYDTAVLITNDSDLLAPIRVIRSEFKKKVGLLNPQRSKSVALDLLPHLDFYRPIRKGVLGASHFPPSMHDAAGAFHKPSGW